MNRKYIEFLFDMIRSAIYDTPMNCKAAEHSEELISKCFAIAKKHDISHLVVYGLQINELLQEDDKESISNELLKAVYRYERQNYDLIFLCNTLEEKQIPYMLLKGSVIRKYYSKPWMRTSCDIDILVRESEVEKAATYLVNNCGYTRAGKGTHDISLFSKAKNHIELHYDLVENGLINKSAEVLMSVWKTSFQNQQKKFLFEMPDEMFYFYHIAHMAKHFENGDCGIRPFIDLWILDNIETADNNKRNELLKQGDLLKFAELARQLSKVWLENTEHTDITKQMEQYIFRGGVYGISENRIAIQQQKKGGRLKYALSKIVLPYDSIKFHYPVLQKHRWLTPFMEIRRWFKLIFCGHMKRVKHEMDLNARVTLGQAEQSKQFLKDVGLG